MKSVLFKTVTAAALAVTVCLFLSPGLTMGFTTIGFTLNLGERDMRIYNNFKDLTANDNITYDENFPGRYGAIQALWKGVVEWQSVHMGTSSWGNGGANFDVAFCGPANSPGLITPNIISALDQNGGNTIAYTFPTGSGWKMRFYDQPWVWHDGPGDTPGGTNNMDLQGICCHEYGHALGLDHSQYSTATMYAYASGSGNSERTIEQDDKDGIQYLYGVIGASKPEIFSLSGSTQIGGTLVIGGRNFSTTGNEVWFTGSGSSQDPKKVTNVPSTQGGTEISVNVPSGAYDGNVLVKKSGTGHAALSNAWPIDIGGGGPPGPTLTSLNPSYGKIDEAVAATLKGANFSIYHPNTITFNGIVADNIVTVDAETITCTVPVPGIQGLVDVEVSNLYGSDLLDSAYLYYPIGGPPFNSATANTITVPQNSLVSLIVSGEPNAFYYGGYSKGGGPTNTSYGVMGLDIPAKVYSSGNLNAEGWRKVDIFTPSKAITFYFQFLVDQGGVQTFATGGNNPNGTGSIKIVVQ